MTKQTENKIGGVGIDRWVKVQDAACSVCYEFYVNQFLLGSLYKTKYKEVVSCWICSIGGVPISLKDCKTLDQAKQKAQEIYDNFIWSGINQEQLKAMIKDAYREGCRTGVKYAGSPLSGRLYDKYADQYIKTVFT